MGEWKQSCEKWRRGERDFCEMGSRIWARLNAGEKRSVAIEKKHNEMKIAEPSILWRFYSYSLNIIVHI